MQTQLLVVSMMIVAASGAAVAAPAATCTPPSLVAVVDRSSSMNGASGAGSKWTAARAALDRVLVSYDRAIEFGLMTFPVPDACGPGRLEVAPGLGQRDAIGLALTTPPPAVGNWTPLAETLWAAADDPAITASYRPSYLVVITDGYQWCSPYDPTARTLPIDAVKRLRDLGVTTFVVGFGAGVDVSTLDAMATVGGTARPGCDPASAVPGARCYYQADDAAALLAALMTIAATTTDEVCDGADNDCDGRVDDDARCPAEQACVAGGCAPIAPPAADAGAAGTADAGLTDDGELPGGCGCAAGGAGSGSVAAGLALVLAGLGRRRRRARRR